MLTLDEMKRWLRIDGDEDDSNILLLLGAAKASLKVAGVPEEKITSENEDLYKKALLIHLDMDYEYDERKIPKLERAFQHILLQLKAGALGE